MSSKRRHPHKGGPTPTTEPKDRPGVVQFSVSEVAQFSMSLDTRRYGKGKAFPYFIRRQDLRAFARRHPKPFGGLSEADLIQLLDSEMLAAEIAAMGLPRYTQLVEVKCVETGKRFPSIAAAAAAAFVTPQRMRVVCNRGGRANGRHYRRVGSESVG